MTIGPSNCGKSFLCGRLEHFLKGNDVKYRYITSDGERREILGENLHKHDHRMMAASKGAFEMLHLKLDIYSRYPINMPVLILDATHLSKQSRAEVAEYAKKNNYNLIGLLFDYKDINDYFKYVDEKTDKRIIMQMAKQMRKEVVKEIDRTQFKTLHRIDSIDFSDISFEIAKPIGKGRKMKDNINICVVGDIHGCYEELLDVLQDNKGFKFEDLEGDGIPYMTYCGLHENYIHHVLIGDIVDKGDNIGVLKLIIFLHRNRQFFYMLEGNHERWNYQYLKGIIKKDAANTELVANYFTSVPLFENNPDAKRMFFDLYENDMTTFAYNDKMIVTHAPCENKFLGKEDKTSLKRMNTIMYPKRKDFENDETYLQATEDFFRFLITDSEINYPFHVFGHVMLKSAFTNKNKVGIDLGCVVGGYLCTATFMKENRKPFIKKYKSKQPETKVLHDLFRTRQNAVSFGALDIDLQKRLKWCAKNGVNFISGTMSPVNKFVEIDELESLAQGIKYYFDKGITSLIIEPKFMGSRAQAYILNPKKYGYGIKK